VIAIFLIIIIGTVLTFQIFKHRERYILLSEVIPQGRIISREDGVIEYKGVHYIVGTDDLLRKRHLIESLNLLNLDDSVIVDLRFRNQIIIRNSKKGRGSKTWNRTRKTFN